MRRVNEAIKEIIGTALTKDIKDPRIGFVTLTGVDTAPDLSQAKVFYSVYGRQRQKEATLAGLKAARPYLQRRISDELKLKRTPTLEFLYDTSVDRGMRIQAMLKASGVAELPPERTDPDVGSAAYGPEAGRETGSDTSEAGADS